MAWHTRYCCFPNEATARAVGAALGIDFPDDGSIPSGNQNYALHAPMQAPEGEGGYWALLRLNDQWAGYAATVAQVDGSGFVRDLTNPPVVWA